MPAIRKEAGPVADWLLTLEKQCRRPAGIRQPIHPSGIRPAATYQDDSGASPRATRRRDGQLAKRFSGATRDRDFFKPAFREKLDHPRQLALMHALVRFAHIAAGGA